MEVDADNGTVRMDWHQYAPDQVEVSDVRWVGHGMFDVSLATPAGPLSCMVDRNGNVRSIDER